MKKNLNHTLIITGFLFSSYTLSGQQKEDYLNKIDSLIKTTNIRPLNVVILII